MPSETSKKKPAVTLLAIPKDIIDQFVSGKTVLTDGGPLKIDVPRDRAGSFEPVPIPKQERRFTGFDDKIVAMYARQYIFSLPDPLVR